MEVDNGEGGNGEELDEDEEEENEETTLVDGVVSISSLNTFARQACVMLPIA